MNKKNHLLTRIIVVILLAITGSCKDGDDASDVKSAPPEITSFTPESDVAESDVTINGKNFSDNAEENEVAFNGAAATVTSASTTQLVVVTPANVTTGKITVKVHGLTATSADDFVVLGPPSITDFSPATGAPGVSVVITGGNFLTDKASNIVTFNGKAATVTEATATSLTVTVPADATTGKITVTIGSASATSADDFVVQEPHTITGFSPSIGAPGIPIVIMGENFLTDKASNIVKFNGKTATVTEATETSLTVTVPAEATTGKITVTIGSRTVTSADNFEVCTGSPELAIINVVITGGGSTYVNVTFDIINLGSQPLDLTKWKLQTYLSTDGVNPGVPAGGFILDAGGTLQPGEHCSRTATPNSSADISTYSHVVISAELKVDNSVQECTTANNRVFKALD